MIIAMLLLAVSLAVNLLLWWYSSSLTKSLYSLVSDHKEALKKNLKLSEQLMNYRLDYAENVMYSRDNETPSC